MTSGPSRMSKTALALWLLSGGTAWAVGIYESSPLVYKRAFHPQAADIRVVDGDTVKVKGTSYRLLGFDTPELHITCERQRALSAKDRLSALVNDPATRVLIRPATRPDKYGRVLAQLMVGPTGNRNVADILIGEGLAHPYEGGRRQPWC